jgi:SAM-dependent methyltransferase
MALTETVLAARQFEHAKYVNCYQDPNYRMGDGRKADAIQDIQKFFEDHPGEYLAMLDVGCGRGEVLDIGEGIGFDLVRGLEVCGFLIDGHRVRYGEIYDMPDLKNDFDLVTCFDVLEHIHRFDTEVALDELLRVASRSVILTANNRPSVNKQGEDLHINKMPYTEWDALIKERAKGKGEVFWLKENRHYISETWRIDLS